MLKMAYFLLKNRKKFALVSASLSLGVTGIGLGTLWATKSDKTPITGRNRILLHKPVWDLANGELQRKELEDIWQKFRSEPHLKKKLDLLNKLGVGKLIKDEKKKISPELKHLLKNMPWKVYSALPSSDFYGIAFTTSNGNILCDRRWVARGRGFNGVLSHEMSHAICRHANEKEFWKYVMLYLPLLISMSLGMLCYGLSMNGIPALLLGCGILILSQFAAFVLGFRLLRSFEHEADLVGMMLMAWAHIHPAEVYEALLSLDWLLGPDNNQATEWTDKLFSAYPTILERRTTVDDFYPVVLEAYLEEKAELDRIAKEAEAGAGHMEAKE